MTEQNGSRRLHIGILGCRGIPNHYGGYEQFAEYLACGLVRKGHQVGVYISSLHPYAADSWRGVRLIRRQDPENRLGAFGQFIYDLNCLRDARRRKFDVLLQLGYTSSAVWYPVWPADARNIVHLDGLEWKRSKYNYPVRQFLKWMEKLVTRRADALIADSPVIKNYTRETYRCHSELIAYGAETAIQPDLKHLEKMGLEPGNYLLAISRFVPENNLELILEGHRNSDCARPLIVIGNAGNRYGAWLTGRYASPVIRFPGPIYDKPVLDSLRAYAGLYLHGHSVGGTNPSLLEAMACRVPICAHRNDFNAAVLGPDAYYFRDSREVSQIISNFERQAAPEGWTEANFRKIQTDYQWPVIVDRMEKLFFKVLDESRR